MVTLVSAHRHTHTHTYWGHYVIARDKVLGNLWQHVNTHYHRSRQWHLLSWPANKQLGRPLHTRQLTEQQLLHHKLATQCTFRLQSPPRPQAQRTHTSTRTHTSGCGPTRPAVMSFYIKPRPNIFQGLIHSRSYPTISRVDAKRSNGKAIYKTLWSRSQYIALIGPSTQKETLICNIRKRVNFDVG